MGSVLRRSFVCFAALVLGAVVVVPTSAQPEPFARFERWQARRPELRQAPFATWLPRHAPVVSLSRGCTERMAGRGDFVRRIRHAPTDAPQLMEIAPTYHGVRFRKRRADAPFIVGCALAERMPELGALLARHGVREVVVQSAYRRAPRISYHSMGLALDIRSFTFDDGEEVPVLGHYPRELDRPTCAGNRTAGEARGRLEAIACELAVDRSVGLSTVLTPNYPGHEDHFHVDIRPGERRVFLR